MEKEWYLIGRGFNGWYAKGINVSSSGGDLNDYTYWTGEKCSGYLARAVEGALVYDAEALCGKEVEVFYKLILSGPMPDPKLGIGEVNKFSKENRESAQRMLPLLGGGFKTLAVLAQDHSYSGLDTVGLGIYEELLRKIPGIKIGHVVNRKVVWE